MHNLFKFLFLTFLIILSGCSTGNLNTFSCRGDFDCGWTYSCKAKATGGTECAKLPEAARNNILKPKADEQTPKNTDQKEIVTNVIRERDGIFYLPNDTKPFSGKYETYDSNNQKEYTVFIDGIRASEQGSSRICKDNIEVEYKNWIVFLPGSSVPYTGKINSMCSNTEKSQYIYKNGKMQGFTSWTNGQKSFEDFNYSAGSIGKGYQISYKNGQKESEINYMDGKKHGVETWWTENGHKKIEKNYKDGNKDGIETMWYESGNKLAESRYKNGKPHGLHIGWYENGEKKGESHFKYGKEDGVKTVWNEDGRKKYEETYKNGELVQSPQNSTVENEHWTCEEYSDLAKTIMSARQSGTAVSELIKTLRNSYKANSKQYQALESVVISAYEKPRFSGSDYKTKSIEDFRDKAYLNCVKATK